MAEGNRSQYLNIEQGTIQETDGLKTQQQQQPTPTDEVGVVAANTPHSQERDFEDDRAAQMRPHSHPELNGTPSDSSESQYFYNMRRSDFSPDCYEFAMEKANDCERVARQLQAMYHHFIVKLRSASLRMELLHPMRSNVHDTTKLLKTAATDLIASRQKCRDLVAKIHHFGQIAWDQHKRICDIGDELDRVVYALEEQQRVNKEILEFLGHVQDENKELGVRLEQLHSTHEAQRGGGAKVENIQDADIEANTMEENRTGALSENATDDNVDWGSPNTDSELLNAVKNAIDL